MSPVKTFPRRRRSDDENETPAARSVLVAPFTRRIDCFGGTRRLRTLLNTTPFELLFRKQFRRVSGVVDSAADYAKKEKKKNLYKT